jgi:hypothetical protein
MEVDYRMWKSLEHIWNVCQEFDIPKKFYLVDHWN